MTSSEYQNYLSKDREVDLYESRHLAHEGDMAEQFASLVDQYNSRADSTYAELIQSWSPQESNLVPPQKFNDMGMELARELYPDHLIQVITHLDKAHTHNHILISRVNTVTGKTMYPDGRELKRVRDVNDRIAKDNGFSVLEGMSRLRDSRIPQAVRDILARGGKTWLIDVMQKADFARAVSTSFDDYMGVLTTLGVDVRVENKNVTHIYDGKKVRGRKLGKAFTNQELIKQFKENDEKFAKYPELRSQLRGEISSIHDTKGNLVGTPSNLLLESAVHTRFGKKDYSKFTKVERDRDNSRSRSNHHYNGLLPLEEVKKANSQSIIDYCTKNKIGFHVNKSGKTVLTGREHVIIDGTSFKNSKNNTKGTLIDFVAIHHDESYLKAIARINNNPRLLLLEQVTGEVRRPFNSFYMPKDKQKSRSGSMHSLKHFSQTKRLTETERNDLLELNKVQVSKNGSIWLFGGSKGEHAVEFIESSGSIQKKHHGNTNIPYEKKKGSGKSVAVFKDPFDFIAQKGSHKKLKKNESLLVPLDVSSDKSLKHFLSENPHVKHVDIILGVDPKNHHNERREIERLKQEFDPFDIKVRGIDLDGLSRDRGPSFGR